MSKHKNNLHDRHHKDKHRGGNVRRPTDKKGIHKDWRTWAVLVLMLIAMMAYVLSMDESIGPSGGQDEVPAAETVE